MSEHEPIQGENTKSVMNDYAVVLDTMLNGPERSKPQWGFAILVYPFDQGPGRDRINYIGNGKREDVLVAIKELAARWEARE
jgi:hypothetical protein